MKASTILTAATTATVALVGAALPAAASPVAKKFENRIERQADRIAQGVRSGELTRFEAIKLRTQNRRINRKFNRFCRDGRLDVSERRRLRTMLQNASDAIYAEKHDDDRRWARGYRYNHRAADRFDDAAWYNYRRYTRRWF